MRCAQKRIFAQISHTTMYDKNFSVAVIISTYNNPNLLQKTLIGFENQTVAPDEMIIADDGSTEETANIVQQFANRLPIKHIWHEDKGYRRSEILNKAVIAATSEYLIFTDQDCIPRHDFVRTHCMFAQHGFFLSGGCFRLPINISLNISDIDIVQGNIFHLKYLRQLGLKWNLKCIKLLNINWFANIMNAITPARATFNGCNSSCWRRDALAVNGFDETLQYGGLDREFGVRMTNIGIKSKQIRYSAICLHLYHERPYKTDNSMRRNLEVRKISKRQHIIETPNGIQKSKPLCSESK